MWVYKIETHKSGPFRYLASNIDKISLVPGNEGTENPEPSGVYKCCLKSVTYHYFQEPYEITKCRYHMAGYLFHKLLYHIHL